MDFSNLSANELVGSGGTYLSSYNFSSPSIRDNIESFIVNANLQDGLDLIQKVTVQNSVTKGMDFLYSAEKATQDSYLILRQLDRKGNSQADKVFEPTVENLRNLINVHEVIGHVALGMSGSRLNHYYIYKSQVDRHQFNNTTNRFKAHILSKFFYHAQRTGNRDSFLNNSRYRSLFNKYGYKTYLELYNK